MKTFPILPAVLLLAACAPRETTLPPPPPPPAPAPAKAPSRPREQRLEYPSPPVLPPGIVVVAVRVKDGRNEPAPDLANTLVNLLAHNGYSARAREASGIPTGLNEAALAAAAAEKKEGGSGEVLLYAEIDSGAQTRVRMAAADIQRSQPIDRSGFQGPGGKEDEIIHKSLEDMTGRIDGYWRGTAQRDRPPQR